jgi:hypothetical protein
MGKSVEVETDQAMVDQMFKDAGQHLLIKELVLQTLVSQLKGVGVDIDPTPGKMRMVNVRAEQAEKKVAELTRQLTDATSFGNVVKEQTVVTVQPTAKTSESWPDHNAFVESFKVQDHESVAAVKDFDFSSPEAAHLSQEQADLVVPAKAKRKPATQNFPIQPIEAAPLSYDADAEYED